MHTHARRIVQGFVHRQLSLIHAARRELLCAAVSAVMGGHLLSLSRLARALPLLQLLDGRPEDLP